MESKRVGLIGLGEVILEYAWKGLRRVECQGDLKIVSVADVLDRKGTIGNLNERSVKYPKEGKAVGYFLNNFENGSITHFQTDGDRFDSGIGAKFFEGIDMVYMATPNNVRIPFVEQIIEARKDIIIEKPLSNTKRSSINLAHLVCEADEAGLMHGICAEHYAYKDPSIWLLENKDRLLKDYGKINSIDGVLDEKDFLEAERYRWLLNPDISGGGIWLDTGGHMMYLINMMGCRVGSVIQANSYKYRFSGKLESRNDIVNSETAADVFFKLEGINGNVDAPAWAHVRVSKCSPQSKKYFKITFDNGEVVLDFMNNSVREVGKDGKPNFKQFGKIDPYYNMGKMFLDYCNGGKKPPTTLDLMGVVMSSTYGMYDYMEEGDNRNFY